ncbi:MAG: glycosyltransferase family 2 protein [Thermoleophilia bacterium]
MKVLAIVRALNEQATVGAVVCELRAALPEAEILVVDDGSTDATAAVAALAGARVERLPRNVGMCAAAQHGYRVALREGFDAAVQVDGDGQHRGRDAAALVAALTRLEVSVVVGSRFLVHVTDGDRSTLPRRLGNRVLSRGITALSGQRVTDATSGLRAVDRTGIAVFAAEYPRDDVEAQALLVALRHGLRMAEVPVVMRARRAGRSSITPARSARYGWRAARNLAGLAAGRAWRPQPKPA